MLLTYGRGSYNGLPCPRSFCEWKCKVDNSYGEEETEQFGSYIEEADCPG